MKNVIELILTGNSSRLLNALGSGERGLKRFGSTARQEFDRLRNAASSLEGRFASLGLGIGAAALIKQSAQLDKSLIQIGQTAGVDRVKVKGLRKELFRMSGESGQSVDALQQGFNNAVQAGLNFKEALPVIDATNKAMAVTGAGADQLTSGLTVAATAFQFDLAKPGLALDLLDKMTVAGRLGNAELQNLSDIFARVGVNASRSGMGFSQTLSFIEGLSLIEKQPERLATLADSTLRLFTNLQYMRTAQETTGVKFFDEKGARRNPLAILGDLKKKYDALKTDEQREIFMGKALKGADIDTVKGIQTLLRGDTLDKIGTEFFRKIEQSGGIIERDMNEATRNMLDQAGRLRTKMRQAAEDFVKPLNEGITGAIKKLLDPKKKDGWELSGGQVAAGGAAALGAGYLAYRLGGKAIKNVLGKLGGTAAGIAEGKAIEAATGVTPVFVTNWPGQLPGGGALGPAADLAGKGGTLRKLLTSAPMLLGGKLALAGGAGFAAGTGINMMMGGLSGWATNGKYKGDGWLGDMLYDLLHKEEKTEVKPTINVSLNVDQNGRMMAKTDNMNTQVNLKRGKF